MWLKGIVGIGRCKVRWHITVLIADGRSMAGAAVAGIAVAGAAVAGAAVKSECNTTVASSEP